MTPETLAGQSDSRYLAIFAFDIRRFSSYTDTQRTRIASEFRDAIEGAFHEAGLGPVWNERVFCQNSGDGIVTGFDHRHLRALVDRLPLALQHRLKLLFQRTGLTVRMRLGVSVGPVQGIDDQRVDIAPNQTVIEACRLCDAKATRMLLEHSDERATFLAVAVSSAVMADSIGRDPAWLQASEFVRVEVESAEKDYHAEAYVHVPSPSGDLLRFGLAAQPTSQRAEQDESLETLAQRGLAELCATPAAHLGEAAPVGGGADHNSEATAIGTRNRIDQDHSQRRSHNRTRTGRDDRSVHGGTSITVNGNVGNDLVGGDKFVTSSQPHGEQVGAMEVHALRQQLDEILRAVGAAERAGRLRPENATAASREIAAARDHVDQPGVVLRSLRRGRTFLQETSSLAASVTAVVDAIQGLR